LPGWGQPLSPIGSLSHFLSSPDLHRSIHCSCQDSTSSERFRYLHLIFHVQIIHNPDDGGRMHLWKVGLLQQDYTALYIRRLSPS
jgi:hypothetical protein